MSWGARITAPLRRGACVTGLVTAVVTILLVAPAGALGAFSISNFQASPASAPAGSHPNSTVSMSFGGGVADDVKDIIQHFPAGIIPNPEALPQCTMVQLQADLCPVASRLGPTSLTAEPDALPGVPTTVNGDVYNIEVDPPYIGGLGFVVRPAPGVHSSLAAPFTVRTARHDITTSLPDVEPDLDNQPIAPTARDEGLTGVSVNVPRELDLLGLGVIPIKVTNIEYTLNGLVGGVPYLTTTTACIQGLPMLEATAWDDPGTRVNRLGNVLASTDCDTAPFDPLPFDVALANSTTDAPSGYDISINVPANELPRHQSYLERSQITLPQGTSLSPAVAQGLEGCADNQLGVGTNAPPTCPASSDIGDVAVESKNVPDTLVGNFYLGAPTPAETFRAFIAFPIVDGVWIKLKGTSTPDPQTGQITTVFDDLPMLPFEKFTISLEGGDRAVLVNPSACGAHTLTSTLTPWTGATTFPPAKDEHPEGSFSTSFDGQGASCPTALPFEPSVGGSTAPTRAGASSVLSLSFSNPDRHQRLRILNSSLPPGLVGSLTGIPLCPVAQAAAGSCPEGSRIGSVSTVVGSGASPLPLPGSIYLAEPLQRGDPASLSVVVPARAGPFDFGNVVVRARIALRPDVGLDVVLVDDLPRIVGGIPIRVRTVSATVDRANFTRNPTSCAQLQFGALFTSLDNAQRSASAPYQASACGALPFSPKLRFVASDEIRKDGHPRLRATVTQPTGEANIARSRVVLPRVIKPEVLALQRPGGLCPEAQLAARNCPAGSKVGDAKAVTPLLPDPLSGPVYIVQHAANPLPKLAVFLDGRVSIKLEAQNQLQGLAIVNRFEGLPDVPLTSFELTIKGGKNGILKNGADLCAKRARGDATFTAHSGKSVASQPPIEVAGCKPRVSISLTRVAGGKPVLKLRVKRAPAAARLRDLRIALPKSLAVDPSKVRKGTLVRGSRKLARSRWRLTRKGVLTVRKLPAKGLSSISIVLSKGALTASPALRRAVAARKRPRLAVKLRVSDVERKRVRLTKRLRPRR